MVSDYVKNTIGTIVVAIAGWGLKKQSDLRADVTEHSEAIAVLETKHEDLITLINTRFDSSDGRLERIERSLNGYLK